MLRVARPNTVDVQEHRMLQEVNERESWIRQTTPADLLATYPAAKDGYTNLVCTRGQQRSPDCSLG
jgi:hypothetical protein